MHLIIVEDLETDRDQLAALLRRDCATHEESVDTSFYASGEEFQKHYCPKSCDGLFLDIMLGGLSGIEIARKVREGEKRLPIIFITVGRDYAVDGFAVRATDYLMKPLDPGQVARCMERLREYLSVPSSISLLEPSGWGHSMPVDVALDDSLWETGKTRPRASLLVKLAGLYCCSLDELLTGNPAPDQEGAATDEKVGV